MNVVERATQKLVEKGARTNFMLVRSTIGVKKARDTFHWNFAMGLRAHPLWYMGVNLGISTTHREGRVTIMARMKAKGHVATKLQQFALR